MAGKLQISFGTLYAFLERPKIARNSVAVLLVIHTLLLGYSGYIHSPTLNEPGHLVAGLRYWEFGSFDLYNVNPPLVRLVAALPVIATGYNENWTKYYQGPGARQEFKLGEDFVIANRDRVFLLFTIARWACIPFSWIGAIVCYLWARELYGRPAGVLACTIWCFEPNILAHSSLITSDAAAAALGLATSYTFWRWLKRPSWGQAVVTGVVLGLAELAKMSLILLFPMWPLIWLAYRWADRQSISVRGWLRELGMLALRMLIGLYVLNLGYGFEGTFTQLKKFYFVSDLFTGNQTRNSLVASYPDLKGKHPPVDVHNLASTNRFAGTCLGSLPIPLPRQYVLGIDIQQREFEYYERPSYIRGKFQGKGWWYYYLYAAAIKMPIGWLMLAVFVVVRRRLLYSRSLDRRICEGMHTTTSNLASQIATRHGNSHSESPIAPNTYTHHLLRDELVLLFPGIILFAIVSSQTGISEHMRYVLPALPYFFIAVAQASREGFSMGRCTCRQLSPGRENKSSTIRCQYAARLKSPTIVIVACWAIMSSLWIYPHSLSYFNESVGGPLNGPKHLLGSNVDWGQDLRYLDSWLNSHPEIGRLYLAYHGAFDPMATCFNRRQVVPLQSFADLSLDSYCTAFGPTQSALRTENQAGWYAVSINVNYDLWPACVSIGVVSWVDKDVTKVLRARQYFSRIGYSLVIYRL